MAAFETIRTRLIIAFLAVVLFSLSGLSLMLLISGSRSAKEDIERQVTAIVNVKAQLLREWANTIKADLGNALVGEMALVDVQKVLMKEATPTERDLLRSRMLAQVERSRYFTTLSLVDIHGEVILSTERAQEGTSLKGQEYFEVGKWVSYVSAPMPSTATKTPAVFAAYPVLNPNNQAIGVLIGQVRYETLENILKETSGTREPVEVFLLSPQAVVQSASQSEAVNREIGGVREQLRQLKQAVLMVDYINLKGKPASGALLGLPELQSVLLVEQEREEVFRSWGTTLAVNLSVTLASILVALFIALATTRSISHPVSELAKVAVEIASAAGQQSQAIGLEQNPETVVGPLASQTQELTRLGSAWKDEIGVLAQAFNQMTAQISNLIAGLEQIVEQRTRTLERQARYLEASADVSRAASSILDLEKLLAQAVELIRDRFDLYYVGLFLKDAEGEWAMLRAGTGEAGRILLGRGHRLQIGPTSMIGWCIANDQIRLAQVASEDEVRYATPELPETRSEAAIPLHARGQVIGAISVQSNRPNAFDTISLNVLQTMADQLAIAIDNANLFQQSQQAWEAERRAYALSSQEEWREWLRFSQGLSLRSDRFGVAPAEGWYPEMEQALREGRMVIGEERLAIPIRVRETTIGVITANRPHMAAQNRFWLSDEIAFLNEIADQLGAALESARLFAQIRQRAEQERLVDEITERMRATLDIETVLETAAREMRDALGLMEVEVRLGQPDTNGRTSPTIPSSDQPSKIGEQGDGDQGI